MIRWLINRYMLSDESKVFDVTSKDAIQVIVLSHVVNHILVEWLHVEGDEVQEESFVVLFIDKELEELILLNVVHISNAMPTRAGYLCSIFD